MDCFENPYSISKIKQIKKEYDSNQEETKKSYEELFYYFDGIIGTITSQSMHPAGIIASPIDLIDNYGAFYDSSGHIVLPINMEEIHEIGLAKYDILGLKSIGVLRKTCEYANVKYPLSHELDWEDKNVYKSMSVSPVGLFQFEGDYAFKLLSNFIDLKLKNGEPTTIDTMSLVNASLRPSGESYRDRLLSGEKNVNPSPIIDELLKDNNGYLIFQEDTIKFLQQICGLSGSDADNVRRAIGRKQLDRLQKALPQILEGYCNVSTQPREVAEEEAKQFLQIIEDSSNYQFGFNHSTGYSMVGYMCAYMRHYYPVEFCTAYLNCANGQDKEQDIKDGTRLAMDLGITISKPKFGKSLSEFVSDAENKTIYKGLESIKNVGKKDGDALYELRNNNYPNFFTLLKDIKGTCVNKKSLEILIKLDYFSQFGHPHQLLAQVDIYAELSKIYEKFADCKVFKKAYAEELGIPITEIAECSNNETAKQFKELDNKALVKVFKRHYKAILNQISAKYPYKPTTTLDRIKYEVELLGYTDLIDERVNENHYIVTNLDVNKYGSKFATLYNISSGFQQTYKCDNRKQNGVIWHKEYPFEVGDVLNCIFRPNQKGHYIHYQDDEGNDKKKWELIDEWETVLKKYSIQ